MLVLGRLPIADTRDQFADLFSIYQWVTIAAAAVVFGAVLFALARYHRRDRPSPRDKHVVLESVYAVVLTTIAIVLVTLTFRTEDEIQTVASRGGVRVDVLAFQWQWRFGYPDHGKTVLGTNKRQPTLVLPVRTLIRFNGISRDVIHSFWIPSARFKRDEFPERHTKFDLSFDRTGTFIGRCAEFCGLHHTDMDFFVRVVTRAEFERWVRR